MLKRVIREILTQIVKGTSRLHLWPLTILVVRSIGKLELLSFAAQGRFAYAVMMSSEDVRTRRTVAMLIRRYHNRSCEINLWLGKVCWQLGAIRLASLLFRRSQKLAGSRAERELSACFFELARNVSTGSIYESVASWLNALRLPEPTCGPLIVTAVSSRYLELFDLWKSQCDKHLNGHRVLLALDKLAVGALSKECNSSVLDLSSYFVFNDGGSMEPASRSFLWMFRVLILRELARRRYTVYSLDVDAIIVGDIVAMEQLLPTSNIVSQIDYSIPMDVARKLGFIVCCGMMVIRPSAAVDKFLAEYSVRTLREMDDQLALNHLIMESGIHNRIVSDRYMTFNSHALTWVLPDKSLVSRDVHYGQFVRHFILGDKSVEGLRKMWGLS